MKPEQRVLATYQTRQGTHAMLALSAAELGEWLPRQRREVKVYLARLLDSGGEPLSGEGLTVVGEAFWCEEFHGQRNKAHWCWWWEGLDREDGEPQREMHMGKVRREAQKTGRAFGPGSPIWAENHRRKVEAKVRKAVEAAAKAKEKARAQAKKRGTTS
jgi:hypothetical protein